MWTTGVYDAECELLAKDYSGRMNPPMPALAVAFSTDAQDDDAISKSPQDASALLSDRNVDESGELTSSQSSGPPFFQEIQKRIIDKDICRTLQSIHTESIRLKFSVGTYSSERYVQFELMITSFSKTR